MTKKESRKLIAEIVEMELKNMDEAVKGFPKEWMEEEIRWYIGYRFGRCTGYSRVMPSVRFKQFKADVASLA